MGNSNRVSISGREFIKLDDILRKINLRKVYIIPHGFRFKLDSLNSPNQCRKTISNKKHFISCNVNNKYATFVVENTSTGGCMSISDFNVEQNDLHLITNALVKEFDFDN
jgi:hypothetical protein